MGHGLSVLIFLTKTLKQVSEQIKITKNQIGIFIKWLSLSFLTIVALRIVLAIIFALTGILPEQPHLESYPSKELLFEALIKAPLIESILIIGLLIMFNRLMNQKTSIFLTAILFGVMHLDFGVNWMTIFVCALSGYLFSYFYLKAQSYNISGYWLIVLMHSFDNAITLIPDLIQYFKII